MEKLPTPGTLSSIRTRCPCTARSLAARNRRVLVPVSGRTARGIVLIFNGLRTNSPTLLLHLRSWIGIKYPSVALRAVTCPHFKSLACTGVSLVRLGFRNRTGFHECPQCKSRSVWKADPYGTLEETLYRFLKLSPYRCARCDRRFLDSKILAADAPPAFTQRWLSRASRLLQRRPLDETLRLYSIFGQVQPDTAKDVTRRVVDRSFARTPTAVCEPGGLSEKSGLRA